MRFLNLALLFLMLFHSNAAMAKVEHGPLVCKLDGTADHFQYYSSQLVYFSEQFAILQNFKGRVTTQIDLKTNKFIRTTFIGEPFEPSYQTLNGKCESSLTIISIWNDKIDLGHALN